MPIIAQGECKPLNLTEYGRVQTRFGELGVFRNSIASMKRSWKSGIPSYSTSLPVQQITANAYFGLLMFYDAVLSPCLIRPSWHNK